MTEININDFDAYDFENAQKKDTVIVATILYEDLQSIDIHTVKSVSPKRGDVTLDNNLKYSKTGYEYGRSSFYNHLVFVYSEEKRKLVESYMTHRKIARKVMDQIREINIKLMMKNTVDNCRKLSFALDEILEVANNDKDW